MLGGAAGTVLIISGLVLLCAKLYRDGRHHRRTTKRLRESEGRLQTILDTSPLALAIYGLEDHRLTYANPRWCELYGIPTGGQIGHDAFGLFIQPSDCVDLCHLAVSLGYVAEYECRMRRHNGPEFWALLSATRIQMDGQEALCLSATDISKRKEHEALLALAKSQAEETSRSKSQFLATMSHEIRTPMNGVMTMANLLQEMPMSSEQREMARIIYDSSNALLGIINDILDFSKIEAGRLHLETVEFSVQDVVEGVADLLAPRAVDKGIDLIGKVDPAVPDRVLGDPVRLRQILTNLAGNAVKFTDTGHVHLSASIRQQDGNSLWLRAEVRDTGIGLDQEQQSRLFAPFSQADASIARRYGGTGLGLSISQRLVDLMGGRIGVRSTRGQGATFWCEIPLTIARNHADPWPNVQGLEILLVSNNPGLIDVVQTIFRYHQGQVVVSGPEDGGLSALRAAKLAGWHYDLVLLDCGNDWRWGLESGLAVRSVIGDQQPVAMLLPAPFLSVAAPDIRHANLLRPLSKPLRRGALLRLAAAAAGRLPKDELETGGAEVESYLPPTIEEAAAADALILVAEDNPTNQAVIRRLMSRLGFAVEVAVDGEDAWDRMQVRDYGLLLTDCHMPNLDGYQLTARVRAAEQDGGRRTPIVALTADVMSGTADRCHQAGMDGIIAKPIDLGELERTIRRFLPAAILLRRSPEPSDGIEPEVEENPHLRSTPVLDLTPIRLIFGTVNQDAKELLMLFVSSTRPLVEELQQAIHSESWEQAIEAAHGAKGAANSAGCYQFAQFCADMEHLCANADHAEAQLLLPPLLHAFDHAAEAIAELNV